MKVKVAEGIVVEVQTIQKQTCPAGTAYWQVDYLVDGLCIHSATTGAIFGNPDVIAMLDREYEVTDYHYQDIENPDPKPEHKKGMFLGEGTTSGRPAWWQTRKITHRQAIIDAYQIIE